MVYALSLALCGLFTIETILIAYSVRHSTPVASSKLLVLAEAVKFLISWSLHKSESGAKSPEPGPQLSTKDKQHATAMWRAGAVMFHAKAMLIFSVPAVCYFVTNK